MQSGLRMQVFCTCTVYLSYMMVGITRGFINFSHKQLLEDETLNLDHDSASWIASLCIFPNPIGSLLAGYLMDKIGRISSLKLSIAIFSVGWILIAFALNVMMLFAGVFIIGISVGMFLCSSVYVAEITEESSRCILLSVFIIFFTSGISLSYVVTCLLHWRTSAGIFLSTSCLVLLALTLIPESPQWYAEKGHKDKAIAIIEKMRDHKTFDKESEYNRFVSARASKDNSVVSVAAIAKNWKPLGIFILFQICVQCSGYSILISYSNKLFGKIDLPLNLNYISIGYSLSIFFSSFLSPFAVICWSRKALMKVSGVGMTLSLSVMLSCINMQIDEELAWIIPICSYFYVITCTIGSITLSECMPSELYRTEVRGLMCGVTQAFSTILTGTLIKIFPGIADRIPVTYVLLFFIFFSFMTLLFGIFVLPETKGKSLDQIQEEYFSRRTKDNCLENGIKPEPK